MRSYAISKSLPILFSIFFLSSSSLSRASYKFLGSKNLKKESFPKPFLVSNYTSELNGITELYILKLFLIIPFPFKYSFDICALISK